MLRKGTITSIETDGSGIITDENDQEIPFVLQEQIVKSLTGTPVQFKIELASSGLIAVCIELLHQN
jgi:hypothetical protein